MNSLKKADVLINRKMLSEMAIHDSEGFSNLVNMIKGQTESVPA